MLSPVKAITTAALVLGLSAAFLVAQPSDRLGGSVAGAEQAAEPAAPVEVTARHRGIVSCDGGSVDPDGSFMREYGFTCEVDNEWSDPRLQGTETYVDNSVSYTSPSASIGHFVHDIVTDDGAWRMRPQFRLDIPGERDDFPGTWVLDGEGAYEGLIAVLNKEREDLHGFIISSDLLPPAPEGASTK